MGFVITDLLQPDDYSGGRIERIDLVDGTVDVLYTECDGNPLWGPNDLVFEGTGGMWFTDHGKIHARSRTHGGVYYARPDGSGIEEVIYPLDAPNGIGLSPDGSRLYVAETHTGRVFEWGVSGPGRIEKLNPASEHGGNLLFGAGNFQLFDSLAVDSAGNVVVGTLAHNAGLTVIAPDGSGVEQVPMPDPLCTNVCFGGPDLMTAFVTLSATGTLASLPWPRPGLALAF
jgi:gluconolactonase